MYTTLVTIHSLFRWIVLISLCLAIYRGFRGWKSNKSFTPFDNRVRHYTATFIHIQLILGLWLLFISPFVAYFWEFLSDEIHERETRFFGLEHPAMMIVAVILVTIGSYKAKRKLTDQEKFKTMFKWYAIALFIILSSIPWGFAFFVDRPYFRGF